MNDPAGTHIYRFGPFTVDIGRGMLFREGQEVLLRPQSFEVLALLLKHRRELVSREQIMSSVWGARLVTDASITQCLVEIRAALADSDRSMVRTMPRRGYIFDADVVVEEGTQRQAGPLSPRDRVRAAWPALVVFAGALVLLWLVGGEFQLDGQPPVLAVMSFESSSDTPSDRHFAAGLQDQVLSALDTVDGLQVIAPLSVEVFERGAHSLADAFDTLGATHVLTGSVSRFEDIVRLTVQVFDSRSSVQLLSHSYERPSTVDELSDLQRDVAVRVGVAMGLQQRIVDGSTPRPLEHARGTLKPPPSGSLEAYNHYMDGLYFLRRIQVGDATLETFDRAAARFEASIAADPEWAPPQAALGAVLHFKKSWVDTDDEEEALLRASLEHVSRALELDPDYGPAYVSLGFIRFSLDLDYAGAQEAYDRAYALGDRMEWAWASALLASRIGDFGRAIELFEVAQARDPLNLIIRKQTIRAHVCAGRYEEAIERTRELQRIVPDEPHFDLFIAYSLIMSGQREQARGVVDAIDAPDLAYGVGSFLALLNALLDRVSEAERIMADIEAEGAWADWEYAEAAVVMGQQERALAFLERGVEEMPRRLAGIQCSPFLDTLKGNPRYDAILAQLGF